MATRFGTPTGRKVSLFSEAKKAGTRLTRPTMQIKKLRFRTRGPRVKAGYPAPGFRLKANKAVWKG